MPSKALLDAATAVVAKETATCCYLDIEFQTSDPSSSFSFKPLMIDHFTINKDFADSYADEIYMTISISPRDASTFEKFSSTLNCTITQTFCDKFGNKDLDRTPVQKNYQVMLSAGFYGIGTSAPDVHLYSNPYLKLPVMLIEKSVYNCRLTKINGILPKASMQDTIYYLAKSFDLEKIELVKPDNEWTYDHVVLKGYQGPAEVFPYLQKTWGVYLKGLTHYISDGVLYVYPSFEVKENFKKSLLIYVVDEGRFAGSTSLHQKDKTGNIEIVSNTPHSIVSLSVVGSENVGTAFLFNRAAKTGSGLTTMDSNLGAQFTEEQTMGVELQTAKSLRDKKKNTIHIGTTDNPFRKAAELSSHQAQLMTMRWLFSDPWAIDPSFNVTVYSDRKGVMINRKGIIEKAYSEFTTITKLGEQWIYGCTTQLVLRLEPDDSTISPL